MPGPYLFNQIDEVILYASPGIYLLSKDGKHIDVAGRSDNDIRNEIKRILQKSSEYQHFCFEYAPSPLEAYKRECGLYHKYNLQNQAHPKPPNGEKWFCPRPDCQLSKK